MTTGSHWHRAFWSAIFAAIMGISTFAAEPPKTPHGLTGLNSVAARFQTNSIEGWRVLVNERLLADDRAATEKALGLLRVQLQEIVRVVPTQAVAKLREVTLWFSPEYPGVKPRAEYHPGAGWLRDNGRDPVMAKGVEFTDVRNFEAETKRMPNFTLHELAHGYHDRVLKGGFGNAEIKAAYERAKASKSYDKVERWFGNGRANTKEKAYAMTSPMEYFAETTEAFFSRNDFFPFTREELKQHDPEMFQLVEKLWNPPPPSRGSAQVGPPPPELKLPAFYIKYLEADGYPIVASGKVNDYALKEAAYLVNLMLAKRPDVRAAMIKSGSRLCIIAHDEFTTDLPEWSKMKPKDYWDARARGMGGSADDPLCSCAEENLLAFPGDPYAAENILIHEFAHNIHLRGMVNVDPTFDPRVKAAYDSAMKEGLWKGKYASVNHHEYFAEGVQSWFDNNRVNDHDHNHVHLRSQLLEYDPGLAALCREVFGDTVLKYTKPATRLRDHLEGYDPSAAPAFVWPERLKQAKADIRAQAEARNQAANGARPRPPNILFILADDLGYGDVGCYNAESKVPTPNLDRLAREGMRFTDAHSPSTVCTPSRYSLLTGRMAFRIPYRGVFAGAGGPCLIRQDQLTLPQMLRQQGYATAMTGKWHVGLSFLDKDGQRITEGGVEGVKRIDYSRAIPDAPIHRGFDRFFGTACCPATDFLYAFIDGDRIPVPPAGMLDKSKLPKHPYAFDNRAGLIAPNFDLEEVDLVFLKKSREFLEQHAKSQPEKPFFLLHSTHAAHLPSFASKQFQGRTKAGPHGDFIHELDFIVGELMKTLEQLGMADNTVVMFSSDNGPETTSAVHMRADHGHDGARPWRGVKRDQWEGGHRVPFIVRWPGKIAAGSTSDQTVCLTDVMATCAAMTGAALPGNAAEDSFDLLPVLLGLEGGKPVREFTLHQTISLALALRRGPWKYLDHRGSGGNAYDKGELKPFARPDTAPEAPGQLYNLTTDPGETTNLYFQHPEIVRELKALLETSKAQGRSASRK